MRRERIGEDNEREWKIKKGSEIRTEGIMIWLVAGGFTIKEEDGGTGYGI